MQRMMKLIKEKIDGSGLNSTNFEFVEEYPRLTIIHKPSNESFKIDYEAVALLTVIHGLDGDMEAAAIILTHFEQLFETWLVEYAASFQTLFSTFDTAQESAIRQEMELIWNKLDKDLKSKVKKRCLALPEP
jgi:hypothetical protein